MTVAALGTFVRRLAAARQRGADRGRGPGAFMTLAVLLAWPVGGAGAAACRRGARGRERELRVRNAQPAVTQCPPLRIGREETAMVDETHDQGRQSWVGSANGHAANSRCRTCPSACSARRGRTAPDAHPRGGVAIGDMIFDIRAALAAGLFSEEAATAAEARRRGTASIR